MTAETTVVLVWAFWGVSWIAAAVWSKPAVNAAGRWHQLPYRLLMGVGYACLFTSLTRADGASVPTRGVRTLPAVAFDHLWTLPTTLGWSLIALCVVGFLFSWWARLHLGTLWSSGVARKEGHRIVDTGPYGIVRHPIYTGMLLASIPLLSLAASGIAIVGSVLVVVGMVWKAKLEEDFLSDELGADSYAAYRQRVPMLIPTFGLVRRP